MERNWGKLVLGLRIGKEANVRNSRAYLAVGGRVVACVYVWKVDMTKGAGGVARVVIEADKEVTIMRDTLVVGNLGHDQQREDN